MYLKESKTVVIKIGSSLIINDDKSIRERWLSDFAQDIKNLQKLKKNVIIVSSGAIALGCKKLKLNKNDSVLEIGTGWGSFSIHAAQNYVCNITTTTISNFNI